MNCRKVNNLLSAYMDNEVTGEEQLQIRDHLRTCGCCSDEYESLLTTKRIISRICMQDPRPDLEERILARLAAEREPAPAFQPVAAWWGLMPEPQRASLRAAALFGVFAFAAGLYVYSPLGRMPAQPGAVNVAAQIPPAPQMPEKSFNDMMAIHGTSEASQPLSGGASIAPAGLYGQPVGGAR